MARESLEQRLLAGSRAPERALFRIRAWYWRLRRATESDFGLTAGELHCPGDPDRETPDLLFHEADPKAMNA